MRLILAMLLLLPGVVLGQNTPIRRGILQTPLNGNGQAITNTGGFGIGASLINSWDDVTNYFTLPAGGGGANQSPWTNNINGAGFFLTNSGGITVTGTTKVKHIQIGAEDAFASQDISVFKNSLLPAELTKAWINLAQLNGYLSNWTMGTEWWANTGTNDSIMAQSWLTRTNGVQDGTNRTSYWSSGDNGADFYWKMQNNERDVLRFTPADNSTPNYVFDTYATRIGSNIFEVKNNTTNVFVVDYLGNATANGVVLGAGGGTNSMFEYSISNAAAVGATSITLDRAFVPPATIAGHIAIGFGTTNCEIRGVASVSGNTITAFGTARPLTFAHAAGEKVVWFTGDAYCAFWGMKGDYATGNGTDNSWAMLQALWDSSQEGLRLVGNGSFGISMPMVLGVSAQLSDIIVSALNIYTADSNTNSWFMINQQGSRYAFSVFGTNTITTVTAGGWPVNATNMMVVPYGIGGTNLPSGLTNGIPVFVKAWGTDWLRVGLTESATNEITLGAGTGFLYTEVGGQSKLYFDNVTLDGGIQPLINGLYASVQQPAQTRYLRLNNFLGTALKFPPGTQQIDVNNLEIIGCGVGMDSRDATFVYIKGFNVEQYTNALLGGGHIWGMHIETCNAANGVSVDLTQGNDELMIDGFRSSTVPGLNGVVTHTHFLLSDSNSFPGVDLRRLSFAGNEDDGGIAISDPYFGQNISVWNSTNGNSAARYIAHYQHGTVPDFTTYQIDYGGFTWPGVDGRLVSFGHQNPQNPTMRLRSMTNQVGASLEILRSNGTSGFSVDPNGNIFLATNTVSPSPLGTGGWLWNSNQVLFWITSAQTNLISDGR